MTEGEVVFFLGLNFLEPLFLADTTILMFEGSDAPAFFARHVIVI